MATDDLRFHGTDEDLDLDADPPTVTTRGFTPAPLSEWRWSDTEGVHHHGPSDEGAHWAWLRVHATCQHLVVNPWGQVPKAVTVTYTHGRPEPEPT